VIGSARAPVGTNFSGLNTADPKDVRVEEQGAVSRDFVLEVHSATLDRSFAKVGWMDPYALITADMLGCGWVEVDKTKPDKSAHKKPKWDMQHVFQSGKLPKSIMIAVWDKNNFHKDVFCGAVTIPCSEDMGALDAKEFTLTKKGKSTGIVRLTLKALVPTTGAVPQSATAAFRQEGRQNTLGGEIDQIIAWAEGTHNDVQVTLQENADHPEGTPDEEEGAVLARMQTTGGGSAGPLMGSWKCVDTFGLEDFLKASGVGVFQRKVAMAARWPAWDWSNEGAHILFINHSAIGDLKEEIPLNKEYAFKDGHKNDFKCTAEWTKTEDGGCLKIDRKGKVGDYIEERTVKGNKLEFVLTHSNGVKWGRTFERE